MGRDLLHIKYELKKFFMAIYREIIGEGNNLKNNENIIICYKNSKTKLIEESTSYNNIDNLIDGILTNKKINYCETFFCISSSNTNSREKEDMATRTVLAFDFDNKEKFTINHIQSKCRELGLFYNVLVDSGHGYHIYICIEKTNDIDLVTKAQLELAEKLGADLNACKPTQLLRVPFTYNCKRLDKGEKLPVNLIFRDNDIKRKNINKINNRLFEVSNTKKTIKINCNCRKVEELIKNGSELHCRDQDLMFIVAKLKNANNTKAQIYNSAEKWNEVNENKGIHEDKFDLDYHFNWNYNKLKYASCRDCIYTKDCYSYESTKEIIEGEEIINTNENILKKCKRGVKKNMNGNKIVVYGLLKLHEEGLTREAITERITFYSKKKEIINAVMSERTLKTVLKEMVEDGYLITEKVGRNNLYKLAKERKIEDQYKIIVKASVVYDVVKGYMTQEELQFYCFLCYLQNEQRRLMPNIRGNKLQLTQEEIAKKYGVTRKCINELIGELNRKKYIDKEYTVSQNNGYEYCTYYLTH